MILLLPHWMVLGFSSRRRYAQATISVNSVIIVLMHWILFLVVGFTAGVINAIAGGGSFVVYPLLLSMGIPPVSANASSTLIIFPGQVSSSLGYERYIRRIPRGYFLLLIPCLAGSLLGAYLLASTPDATFERIVPWFVVAAAVLLLLQPRIHAWIYQRKNRAARKKYAALIVVGVTLALFGVSVYGGYFGAGYGIMLLAFLGLTKLNNINKMNGFKNLTGTMLTAIVGTYFVHKGLVAWEAIPLVTLGVAVGGWIGARYSTKLPTRFIRGVIVGIAFTLAVALFIRAY